MSDALDHSTALPCHRCGYDLRAHPQDGHCPECDASVAESRRVAAQPYRPLWAASDPRWRRRVLAAVWILLLLPAVHALRAFDWASAIPLPNLLAFSGPSVTLHDSLALYPMVYQPLIFCIGVVLLFSRERNRQPNRLDWTRRWGILCTYIIFLIALVEVLFLCALVTLGIVALFQSLPPAHQPAITQTLADITWFWMSCGLQPGNSTGTVLIALSSLTILLGCITLSSALRSCGPRWLAITIVAPLAAIALIYLARIPVAFLSPFTDLPSTSYFFLPESLFVPLASRFTLQSTFLIEAIKYLALLAAALRLSIAQLSAWHHGRKAHDPSPAGPQSPTAAS